jgi:hypothetical protein
MDKFRKYFEPLAVAVAGGLSIKAAAAELGIGERSAYRESCRPEFRRRVNEVRTELVTLAMGMLAQTATAAAARLQELVNSSDESVSLRACSVVFDRFSKLSESIDLRERIEKLEQQQQQSQIRVAS